MLGSLLSIEGQRALGFHQQYLNLCSDDEPRSTGLERHEGDYYLIRFLGELSF